MPGAEKLQQVGLFTDVAADTLAALCAEVHEISLDAGDVLFEEGDVGDRAYVVIEGTLEIVKQSEGHDVVLAVQGPGQVVGEMALLRALPRTATVKARDAAQLVAIPKATFDDLLASSPDSARAVFSGLVNRMDDTAEQLRHNERMAQLGTLTAGVAHELNNPAAAVQRGASILLERVDRLVTRLLEPSADGGQARARAWESVTASASKRSSLTSMSALERSDLEDALADLLDDRDVADSWRLAPELVDAGFDVARLTDLLDQLAAATVNAYPDAESQTDASAAINDAVAFAAAASDVHDLVAGISDAAERLSHIVKALKGYSYLDRAPIQDVDIIDGLESTLVLLAHKLTNIRIERDFPETVPTITAVGGDLNQVWTNLIDNAADALTERKAVDPVTQPVLTLAVRATDDDVIVDITDNGPGIPKALRDKVFDAFFTTKPPGSGTGLGLSTTHRIVVKEHHGGLECTSEPGRTTFSVRLPRSGPAPGKHANDTTGPPRAN